ncbi:aromatic hydrocarbon degradation protein [Paracoccus suum]|uniref:Aromatic hydrocarbon degradation protein n=1 Tax=Paracoccus suum TaxID=2259340 RepID=A0A344PJX1_9RHOB|nr:outer membrane protein transport protein [Paracoccus suum]AXC49676.1 aromatic hydrocarbon degradation protein [Paracoccus suum]
MKTTLGSVAALLMTAAPLFAGGIERAPQSINAIFEPGNYAEFSFGHANPRVDGTDVAGFRTGSVGKSYSFGGFAYKTQINDHWSAAFLVETPFGSDVVYPAGRSVVLGGTKAEVSSATFTGIVRYKADNNIGVHAGIRASRASGTVDLVGAGYGPLSTYRADLDTSWGTGWLAGVSWERPDIAARVSLTYQSEISHDFDTNESITSPLAGGARVPLGGQTTTEVTTPRSWNLEGQTGIAADTLLFGSVRWVKWSEFKVKPAFLTVPPPRGAGITEGIVSLDDTITYTLGVGRKFNDNWSGLMAVVYEPKNDEPLSPLAPYNGRKGISLGASYTQGAMKVTGIVSYSRLGDAAVGRGETTYANMKDNSILGVGVRVGYSF